jgi:hypothetical protein
MKYLQGFENLAGKTKKMSSQQLLTKPKNKKKPKDFRLAPMGGKILFINCLGLKSEAIDKKIWKDSGNMD